VAVQRAEPKFTEGSAFDRDHQPRPDPFPLPLRVNGHLHELAPVPRRDWLRISGRGLCQNHALAPVLSLIGERREQRRTSHDSFAPRPPHSGWMADDGNEVLKLLLGTGEELAELRKIQSDGAEQHPLAQVALLGVQRIVERDAADSDHGVLWVGGPDNMEVSSFPQLRVAVGRTLPCPMDETARIESTRLCEACGYIVEDLPEEVCPECGTSVPRSRDARRPGTRWQVRPGFRTWIDASWATLRRPTSTFDIVRIDARSSRALLRVNLPVASVSLAVGAARVAGADDVRTLLALSVLFSIASVTILMLLTAIEARGVRFFGARRGWRITPAVAATVCGHASIGWVIAGILVLLVTTSLPVHLSPPPGAFRPYLFFVAWIPIGAIAFIAGMLVFECLVYLGVRRCRYANTPDSVSMTRVPPV
jgi:predicted RNA-binding Zn-ribbon protein involved in translation (DUF1610 family)